MPQEYPGIRETQAPNVSLSEENSELTLFSPTLADIFHSSIGHDMSSRYQVRIFESEEKDNSTSPGTIVVPIDRTFGMYAASADQVEEAILRDVQKGKLAAGRVYQICPQVGNLELIRSVVVGTDMTMQRVFLDPVAGLYSVLRRIRLADLRPRTTDENSEIASAG